MTKRIFKYATGEPIPDGAVYVSTVTQTEVSQPTSDARYQSWNKCWLVWHYFLVEASA